MNRITVSLTEDQAGSLLKVLDATIHDFDDYSFDDGETEKEHQDERAFYVRLWQQIADSIRFSQAIK